MCCSLIDALIKDILWQRNKAGKAAETEGRRSEALSVLVLADALYCLNHNHLSVIVFIANGSKFFSFHKRDAKSCYFDGFDQKLHF